MKIDLRDNLYKISLNYIKKERYTGSSDGVRFLLEKKKAEEEGGEDRILTCTWPEPFSFEVTANEKKQFRDFPFSQEGLDEAVDYLMNFFERVSG